MGAPLAVVLALASVPIVWQPQPSSSAERLRGVSAPSDRVAWASGNKGTALRTTDGGATWTRLTVPGAEALDFRDVEAFDANTALLLSIGPGDASRLYKTTDGGATWTRPFTNADPKAFYDAIAFWDRRNGLAFGDPVDGRFTVIRTTDGGDSWTPVPPANLPPALEGEGAFAASGTCLVVEGTRNAWFGTGSAARARVFRSTDQGVTWQVAETPVAAGVPSAGLFSLAFRDARHGIAVGGDYRKEHEGGDNVAVTEDGGATWKPAPSRLRAFRSAVAFVPGSGGKRLVALGPAGTDESADGGASWQATSEEGFHALAVSPSGDRAWAVGEGGRIAMRALRTH